MRLFHVLCDVGYYSPMDFNQRTARLHWYPDRFTFWYIYISWDINASVALFGSMNIFEYDFRDTVAHKSNTLSNVAGRTEKKQISHTCLQCAEVQRWEPERKSNLRIGYLARATDDVVGDRRPNTHTHKNTNDKIKQLEKEMLMVEIKGYLHLCLRTYAFA